jgi:hypothetical protein
MRGLSLKAKVNNVTFGFTARIQVFAILRHVSKIE